jgi:hypothetical protein
MKAKQKSRSRGRPRRPSMARRSPRSWCDLANLTNPQAKTTARMKKK